MKYTRKTETNRAQTCSEIQFTERKTTTKSDVQKQIKEHFAVASFTQIHTHHLHIHPEKLESEYFFVHCAIVNCVCVCVRF